jgi:superfamily II DNA or RNA helicase
MAAPETAITSSAFTLPPPVTLPRMAMVTHVLSDGWRVGLAMPLFLGAKAFARDRQGAWCSPHRVWVFSNTAFRDRVLNGMPAVLASWPTFDCLDLRAVARHAYRLAKADLFVPTLDVQLMPLQQGTWACQFHFDGVLVEVMRGLQGIWHKPAGCWELSQTKEEILRALEQLAGVTINDVFIHDQVLLLEDLSVPTANAVSLALGEPGEATGEAKPERVTSELEGTGYLTALTAESRAVAFDPAMLKRAEAVFGLYDYQGEGVAHLLSQTGALLADDMGLGKTRQSIVAAHLAALLAAQLATPVAANDESNESGKSSYRERLRNSKILIVCPASLRINWQREIQAVMSMASDDESLYSFAIVGENEAATLREARWHVSTYERLGAVARDVETRYAVMLIDEAHYLKEPTINRTRNAFIAAARIPRRFLLTGTPVLNRESEIHNLLRITGHPVGSMLIGDFVDQYVGTATKRIALGEAIQGWMMRRLKDVLTHLPAKLYENQFYEPLEGLQRYQRIVDDADLAPLAKIGKLRQLLEAYKVSAIIERMQALEADDKMLVFCEYTETIQRLGEALAERGIEFVSVTGSNSIKQRQAAVDSFQTNAKVRAFLGTSGAAGVGLNLVAANWVGFCGLPWTPAMKKQCEDRAFRNGQLRKVTVYTPIVPNTIDERLHELLESKQAIASDVLSASISEQEVKRLLMKRLAA